MQQPAQSSAADRSAFAQQLLDDVLGHDDTDSIWPPPASLPDSQSPSQEPQAKAPDALRASGAVDMPLMPSAIGQSAATAPLVPNATAGPQLGQPVNAQQQETNAGTGLVDSDGSVTQDSEGEQKSKGEVQQTRPRRGAAAAQGMLTGAYAFPESSVEASQPAAVFQSSTRGKRAAASKAGTAGAAGQESKSGKAGTGSKAGIASKAGTGSKAGIASKAGTGSKAGIASKAGTGSKAGIAGKTDTEALDSAGKANSSITVSKEGSVTGSGSTAATKAGRAVPSSWKTKKAAPVSDVADDAAAPGSLLKLVHALLYFTITPQQQLNSCVHGCSL